MLDNLNPKRHFSLKIMLPVVLLLIIGVSILVIFAIQTQKDMLLKQEEAHLKSQVDAFNYQTSMQSETALALASTITYMPEVQALFAEKDREGLLNYLKPLYSDLNKQFNVEQAQFHLAPATSFLRMNKPEKFGDDLSSLRPMIVNVNKDKKALAGFEYGVTGFGIRGIVPVRKMGEELGSFEIGISFNKALLEKIKSSSTEEYSLLMPDPEKPDEFKAYATTLEGPLLVPNTNRLQVLKDGKELISRVTAENGTQYAVITAPILDYSGNTVSLIEIAKPRTEILAALSTNQTTMILIGIGILLVIAALMMIVINRLTRPLKRMQRVANEIAKRDLAELTSTAQMVADGDLSAHLEIESQVIEITSEDEIGVLEESFNRIIESLHQTGSHFADMTEKLRELIGQVTQQAENVAAASEELIANTRDSDQATSKMQETIQNLVVDITRQNEAINGTVDSVSQMAQAVSDVAHGAEDQAVSVNRATDATSQMMQLINEITEMAQSGDSLGVQAGMIAKNGAESVEASLTAMQRIHSQVNSSSEKVKVMGERSSQIGTIIQTIEEIASQTNLLALNAAIEAARAGEYGKGFAVVADEVKKLAEKSTASTKEISDLVKDIQISAGEAVDAMIVSGEEVEKGVERSHESASALHEILTAVNQVTEQVKDISLSAGRMTSAASIVNASMESVSAVVEENSATTTQMSSDAEKVSKAMKVSSNLSLETRTNMHTIDQVTVQLREQSKTVMQAAQSLAELAQILGKQVTKFKLQA
jgi:methyl-accepting chemotaxis protein